MKEKRIKTFSGLIASTLLIVSICSAPMTAEAQITTSARTSKRPAYSQGITDTVTVRIPTGDTVTIRVPTASREKVITSSQSKTTAGKTVTGKTGSTSAASVRSSTVTVNTPAGEVVFSVPTVSRQAVMAASRSKIATGKTGVSSAVSDTSPEKTAAAPISSRVTENASKDRGTSASAVKKQQPAISNSSDNTLCLVVLGLQLNPSGSMQPELIGRLETIKTAAQSNPQAIIVCTGGHSAEENRAVSEAGQMAKWLRENGIDPNRILVESNGMSTQDNAAYTLKLLKQYHPEVSRIAIFTSDYHMKDGVELFTAQAAQIGSTITVTPGRAWSTW